MPADRRGYDPNDIRDMNRDMVVRVTFQQWGYACNIETKVRGNVCMLDQIDNAIWQIYAELPGAYSDENGGGAKLVLVNHGDQELECEDGDDGGGLRHEEWLKEMVSSICFIRFEDREIKGEQNDDRV